MNQDILPLDMDVQNRGVGTSGKAQGGELGTCIYFNILESLFFFLSLLIGERLSIIFTINYTVNMKKKGSSTLAEG